MITMLGKLAAAAALAGSLALGTLTFSSTQSYTTATPQSATGGTGTISFAGSLQTGNPCYVVTGAHTERRNNITVTVTATSSGGICSEVITYNNYTGTISGLSAGTYNFTVVHRIGSSSTTAYTSTVVVQ